MTGGSCFAEGENTTAPVLLRNFCAEILKKYIKNIKKKKKGKKNKKKALKREGESRAGCSYEHETQFCLQSITNAEGSPAP